MDLKSLLSSKERRSQFFKYAVVAGNVIMLLAILLSVLFCVRYYKMKRAFKSFDLAKIAQEEFIFQTIEFKKFIPYGTDGESFLGEYADELQIYYVSGHADVLFRQLDEKHLVMNEGKSDYDRKILRLDYYPDTAGQSPFDVKVSVNEKDIYQVYKKQAKKILGVINAVSVVSDVAKADKSPDEVLVDAKEKLEKEFKDQLKTKVATADELKKSELYQDFLKQFSKMVSAVSDWEQVEIDFGGQS